MLAVVVSSFACANKPGAPEKPEFANGRCSCEGGALCLQAAGAPVSATVCAPAATAGLGCAAFTNASRSCWGSPKMAGLCLCSGDLATKLAAAH